jgi:hypothetical protein
MVLEIIKSSDKALIGKRFILEPEEAKKQDTEDIWCTTVYFEGVTIDQALYNVSLYEPTDKAKQYEPQAKPRLGIVPTSNFTLSAWINIYEFKIISHL